MVFGETLVAIRSVTDDTKASGRKLLGKHSSFTRKGDEQREPGSKTSAATASSNSDLNATGGLQTFGSD